MNETPDPLQEWLAPSAHDESTELRERLRNGTCRIVRRRRLLRRTITASAVAACLFAAITIVYFTWTRPLPPVEQPPIAVVPPAPENANADSAEELPPLALEWRAFDSQDNRATAYFLAGNKYLEAGNDLESALRCYRQALDACTPQQLEIVPDDNWLVASLKNARRKEIVQ